MLDLHNVLKAACARETDPAVRGILHRRVRRAERGVWIARGQEVIDDHPLLAMLYLFRSWLRDPQKLRTLFVSGFLAIPLPQTRRIARNILRSRWPA